jgi:hypothetical protein
MTIARSLAVFALAALSSTAVLANEPPPTPTCVRPEIPAADKNVTDAQAKQVNAASKAYTDCASAYHAARKQSVEAANAVMRQQEQLAKAHIEAANKLQGEVSAFIAELNANVAAREKAQKAGK